MPIARISPSKLERFRMFLDGEFFESITEQNVVDSIMGVSMPTTETQFGSAYHHAIEKGPEKFWNAHRKRYAVRVDRDSPPFYFTEPRMAPAIRFRNFYAGMCYEIPHVHRLTLRGVNIEMHMRIDGIHGLHLHEQKTTRKQQFFDMFSNSLQWKIYLAATGAKLIQYNVFVIEEKDNEPESLRIRHEHFRLYPTPDMVSEINNTLVSYLEFVENKNLQRYVFRE